MIDSDAVKKALDQLGSLTHGARLMREACLQGKYENLCECGSYHDCHKLACAEVERVLAPEACCPVWMAEVICEQIRHMGRMIGNSHYTPDEKVRVKSMISADFITAVFEMYLLDSPKKIKSLSET